MSPRLIATIAVATLLWRVDAALPQEPTPQRRCEAAKRYAIMRYEKCRARADKGAARSGDPPDYTKCEDAYSRAQAELHCRW